MFIIFSKRMQVKKSLKKEHVCYQIFLSVKQSRALNGFTEPSENKKFAKPLCLKQRAIVGHSGRNVDPESMMPSPSRSVSISLKKRSGDITWTFTESATSQTDFGNLSSFFKIIAITESHVVVIVNAIGTPFKVRIVLSIISVCGTG